MIKIMLTGYPGVGKTTCIMKINDYLKLRGLTTGGFITVEEREGGKRVGFKIIDISNLKEGWLAHVSFKDGPSVGKYRVNVEAMERIGVAALDHALKNADVILVDEVGPMEMCSSKFREKLAEVMASDKPVVLTLHRSYVDKKLPELETKHEVVLFQISQVNREAIPLVVSREILKRIRK
ncbi:hypothetical protein B6U99_03775 [Candidatus Geothermarchaeota archaeon ex4572_27]|nr:MAG: hypothetical protein B6U99_03775 [Candidatus Geothermarchaeota archaeon ex4572_27]